LVTAAFARKNPVLRRTIEIRGDQTLRDLHQTIFTAFDREDEHLYEFQFGTRPMDPKCVRYVLPAMASGDDGGPRIGGLVHKTTLASLPLKVGDRFGYWFDFGDDWWHQINVEKIEKRQPEGVYPRLIASEGESPPQYPDFDEAESEEEDVEEKPKKAAKPPKKPSKPRKPAKPKKPGSGRRKKPGEGV
jgi:hypothetical protein